MNDNIFKRIEEKTNVDRDTIINLARKLQNGNYKNEQTLKEIIHELSDITGIEVSSEKEQQFSDPLRRFPDPAGISGLYPGWYFRWLYCSADH